MKFFLKILFIGIFIIGFSESKANTLLESLQAAYLNNSKLNAERANMRSSREEKREAVSEFLPNVTISGYKSSQDSFNSNENDSELDPKERSILVGCNRFNLSISILEFSLTFLLPYLETVLNPDAN